MQVIVAENYGFCFGVDKSIAIVDDALSNHEDVYSIGAVIHNNIVMRQLKNKGLHIVSAVSDIPDRGVLIVRAHGLPQWVIQQAQQRGLTIIDTTCPLVKEVINKGKRLIAQGYKLILIGKPNHPEVIAEQSYLCEVTIIENERQAAMLPDALNYAVISQTTQSIELFNKIILIILQKAKTLHIEKTICYASILRQKSAKKVAEKVDLMFIIGSKSSSNTSWLYKICREYTRSFFIEDTSKIDFSLLKNIKKVGVTAGASAPHSTINEVIKSLEEYNGR